MNNQAFESGKAAYQQGNFAQAAELLEGAKGPGEVSGQIDHLLGNCYMRLGRYEEAASRYGDALRDPSYGNSGGLACNRGRALLAAGRLQDAIASLTMATKDEAYATPFKAYLALGDAYLAAGDPRDAGVAYRNAAIDEANPAPSAALCKLGECFQKLGRATDAIEAYRTALDFASPAEDQAAIFADMGLAYVAANRMNEAADAFTRATASGAMLTPEQKAASEAARKAVAEATRGPSETDALLEAWRSGSAASPATPEIDPLDPLGKSGEFIPSPEDTGFFSLDEQEIVQTDAKGRKKHRHRGLKFFIFLLILLLLLAGAAGYGYYSGYGWPQQQDVAQQFILDNSDGVDVSALISPALDEDAARQLTDSAPSGVAEVASATVTQRSMTSTTVLVEVKLIDGGSLAYNVTLSRDGISWKVTGISSASPAIGTDGATLESLADETDSEGVAVEEEAVEATDEAADEAATEDAAEESQDAEESEGETSEETDDGAEG